MTISVYETIAIIAVVATGTFMTRLFPFALFAGKKEVSPTIKYLGYSLPPAVITILVIYCLRNINFAVYPSGLPEFIAVIIVGLLHFWRRNNLISIGLGTVIYMYLVQKVFAI